ncbi:lipase family protein [Dyella marensis]|uniref:Secretory lipase n=1 Tax=Dyella marensis TaxID=500610 RepID=A0A1I2JR66_9GAMM|nr:MULTISPECIES: lipase family protein [Dyella]SFF55181.1 Secretory lipase [Dyella marensis]
MRAYLNAEGLALLDQDADTCFLDGTLPHLGAGRFENYTIDPAVRFTDSAPGRFFVEANSLVKQPYVPDMPILIYGDVFDDLVGIKPANDLAVKYCRAGAQVEVMHTFTPVPTPGLALVHISGEVEGTLPSLAYLVARFNGQAPRNDCGAAAMSVWSSSVPLPYYPFITQ